MKLSHPSVFLGNATAWLLLLGLLFGQTAAKDLSVRLVHSDWVIEKVCSANLDTIEAALRTHFAATISDSSKVLPSYDCPQVCDDMPNSLCQRITRGYCSGKVSPTAANEKGKAMTAPQGDHHVIPADVDVTTIHCPTYCQDVPNWLCRRITYGYCNATGSSESSHGSPKAHFPPPDDEKLAPQYPYQCPIFCQDVPDWVCARISKGFCKNGGNQATGATPLSSSLEELPYDCSTICKKLPDWVCRRVSRGYCSGIGSSAYGGLVEVATVVATKSRPNPFHCASYCADLPSWLCHRITAGFCTGMERRGLTDADTFDELLVDENLPGPYRRLQSYANYDCVSLCRCIQQELCLQWTNGYCDRKMSEPRSCPVVSPTWPVPMPAPRSRPTQGPKKEWVGPTQGPKKQWVGPTQGPRYIYVKPLRTKNKPKNRDLMDMNTEDDPSSTTSTAVAMKEDNYVQQEVVAEPDVGVVPEKKDNEDVGSAQEIMPYHCPTYCRRVPSSLCTRLTYGYCSGGNSTDKGNDNSDAKFLAVNSTEATQSRAEMATTGVTAMTQSLRGGGTRTSNVNSGCDTAIAAMTAKFDEVVGDLHDRVCAMAIMKSNIRFQCSVAVQAQA